MKCSTCSNTILGFRDSLSIKEYRISGMCQECQDEVFGTNNNQICEECGREIPKGEEIQMSNYTVCSDACARALVGI